MCISTDNEKNTHKSFISYGTTVKINWIYVKFTSNIYPILTDVGVDFILLQTPKIVFFWPKFQQFSASTVYNHWIERFITSLIVFVFTSDFLINNCFCKVFPIFAYAHFTFSGSIFSFFCFIFLSFCVY